jgi:histidyl-tRNA synthetase
MRDFLPADKARRERVLAVIRDTYRSHGFDEIETPVVEDASRLFAGLGGDNEKLAYAVLKRGLTTDDLRAADDPRQLADLGLRFDLTVPLARFYASHRAELPGVVRAIQIAPVWRAERPQKGRYRQFVQCDIDILGEPGPLAEVELITATLATLDALGLADARIRINDRRLLIAMLDALGVPASDHASALITIDKLDKIGAEGVAGELREKGIDDDAVASLELMLAGAPTWQSLADGTALFARDAAAVADLLAIRDGVGAAAGVIELDPFLVRGMGYYTGPIFEVEHPSVPYSLGGGGRYDGMIGRFLGDDVPATGFSLGFERLIELVDVPDTNAADAIALVHDADVPLATLTALKTALIADGARVRLARRTKNLKPLLASLAADGFTTFAFVTPESTAASLEKRPLE